MSTALTAGVTGLQAHQKMLDVTGNNLANVNTTAFKASKVNFAELFSQTVADASSPSSTVGGTNPQQMGSGVSINSITRDTTQGNIIKTGNPLDAAIEGEGFFTLYDGEKAVFTRAGTFSVDESNTLVEVGTGYRVQRIGQTGEGDNFQIPGDSNIYIPYDKPIEPNATTEITLSGNLSSDQSFETAQSQVLNSSITFTTGGGTEAANTTTLSSLDQLTSGTISDDSTITLSGYTHDGTQITGTTAVINVTGATTLSELASSIETAIENFGTGTDVTVSITNGKIRITDNESGYSKLDVGMTWADTTNNSAVTLPGYFEYTTVGGEEVKDVNIAVYDHLGTKYTMAGAFVRTNTENQWDFVLSNITGPSNTSIDQITADNRRVSGLDFNANNGTFAGLNSAIGDTSAFYITFDSEVGAQTISLDFGIAGQFSGITQVAGTSTAVATDQDGYAEGNLSSLSIDNSGVIVGSFSNGERRNIAMIQLSIFDNAMGLESIGKGFFTPTVNSGTPVGVEAMTSGAGKIYGSSLEKSNADVADEFVNLIQAQNGYQANARTIRVANEILQELTNLIR